jgi:4-hydroxy-3-methylbut-2-enyl diphosphate reductase
MVNAIQNPGEVTLLGPLVHNPTVQERLAARGFRTNPQIELREIPLTPKVLVPAHGISTRDRRRLEQAGKQIIDTTCPFVRGIHRVAERFRHNGRFTVVIGKLRHTEVQGIVRDLAHFAVVLKPEQVRGYAANRIGVLCQSTIDPALARTVAAVIRVRNPTARLEFAETICEATLERRRATLALVRKTEAVVVAGGKNSNNTRELVTLVESEGIPCLHVERADEIPPGWPDFFQTIGVTAGASTLDETIDEVCWNLSENRAPACAFSSV